MSERWIDPGLETTLERIVRERTIAECAIVAWNERLSDDPVEEEDRAYNLACRHVFDAISALRASPPGPSDEGLPTADDVRGILGPPPPSQDETIKALLWALAAAEPILASRTNWCGDDNDEVHPVLVQVRAALSLVRKGVGEMSEPSIDEIVARVEVGVFGNDPQGDQRVDRRDLRAFISDWRKKKEALEMARPFVALTLTQEQAEASPRWYRKASNALIALDAALKGAAK